MSDNIVRVKTGSGAGFVLFIVFLILKLTKTIDWSWWWVTAPLWGPLAFVVACLVVVIVVYLLFVSGRVVFEYARRRASRKDNGHALR